MFKELSKMLAEGDALVINVVALKEGRMSVIVIPMGDIKNEGLREPLKMIDVSPEELDVELADVLTSYVSKRVSLREQVEAAGLVLEAAKASVTANVAKSTSTQKASKKPLVASSKAAAEIRGSEEEDERQGSEGGVELASSTSPVDTEGATQGGEKSVVLW